MISYWLGLQISLLGLMAIFLVFAVTNLFSLRRLSSYRPSTYRPRVSILVPARNEDPRIEACLRSLLDQDYPDFEVIVLDDNSTDDSWAVMTRLAATDSRLKVIRGKPLPEDWMGKHWACSQLRNAAAGELLLFTDADTVHQPRSLSRAVDALHEKRADLVTAIPRQKVQTWGEKLIIPLMSLGFYCIFPSTLAALIKLPVLTLSVGQFMLFRRSAYDAVGGHAAVRGEIVDDVELGRAIRAAGLNWHLADAADSVSCRMYTGFTEAAEGFSKFLFPVFRYNLPLFLLVWLCLGYLFLEPFVFVTLALLGRGFPGASIELAVATALCSLLLWGIAIWRSRFPIWLALLYPLITGAALVVALDSLIVTSGGRRQWKGRALPEHRLRFW